jgi:nucleoside phosphorylase
MLHILCALKHEARPIIEHYRLIHDGSVLSFITYCNDNEAITLTITGVGKHAAAEGTRFVADFYHAGANDAWLNVGIAGHKRMPIGTLALANKITDAESQQVWYPRLPFPTSLNTLPLTTVNEPEVDYEDNDMIDMEAAGFFRCASEHAAPGLIHCLKIISDNEAHRTDQISKQTIRELISSNIPEIENYIMRLGVIPGLSRNPV